MNALVLISTFGLFTVTTLGHPITPPPVMPLPENDWELLAVSYEMIVVLDEVISSKFAYVITVLETCGDTASQEANLVFVSTPVFRVTASVSRFLKTPDGFEFLADRSVGMFSFYEQGSVVRHSSLQDVSLDECRQPTPMHRRGDILLIKMKDRPWFGNVLGDFFLYDSNPANDETDIIEGIRTWNEKDEAWRLEWHGMNVKSNQTSGDNSGQREAPTSASHP